MSKIPFGIIYKATNLVNGKCYIGQTIKDPVKYWIGHLKSSFYKNKKYKDKIFYNSIRKHGPENFLFEVLEFCDSKEELNEIEFHYIKQYKTFNKNFGYNMTIGGDGTDNNKQSDELRKRRSEWMKEMWKTKEHREKLKNTHTSIEYKEKRSTLSKEIWERDGYREKLSEISTEVGKRPEVKENRSKVAKEKWKDSEYREKMVKERIERKNDKEYIQNLSDKIKKKWEDPIYREKSEKSRRTNYNTYIIICPDGKEEIVNNIYTWCKERKLQVGNLLNTLNGSRKHHKQYKVKCLVE